MGRRVFIIAILVLFGMLRVGDALAAPAALAWKAGDRIAGWEVVRVVQHPEFIRLELERDGLTSGLEIVSATGRSGPYCTSQVCIQPAPEQDPPPELLSAARDAWEAAEQQGATKPQVTVVRATEPEPPDLAGDRLATQALSFWAAVGLVLASLILSLVTVRRLNQAKATRLALWLLMLFPAVLLLIFTGALGWQLIRVARLDHGAALAQLAAEMDAYQPPPFELTQDPPGTWRFEAAGKRIEVRDGASRRILVFGGSSVVLPVYERAFPALLEEQLNSRGQEAVQVLNLGEPGYDSGALLERVRVALPALKPDLIILYMGHNDYTAAYRKPIAADFDVLRASTPLTALAWLAFLAGDYQAEAVPWRRDLKKFSAFLDTVAEPTTLLWLQRLGFVHVPPEPFERVNCLVVERFARNLNAMLELARQQKVKVLLMTPIGNLAAPVYGVTPEDHDTQLAALAIDDYEARIRQLRRAKDQDAFSLDIRAKTPLLTWIRQIERPDVRLLDLERALIKLKYPFDFNGFRDYVHFLPDTHKRVADLLEADLRDSGWLDPIDEESADR